MMENDEKFQTFLEMLLICQIFNLRSSKYRTLFQTNCKNNYADLEHANAREIFKYFNSTNYVATKFNYILLPKRSWDGEIENDIKC